MWLRHDGAATGVATNVSGSWQGPREVDRDWGQYKQIFAGDNGDIYTIKNDGILQLHQHSGFQTGLGESEGGWQPARSLSKGWGNFKQAFSGGGGMLYAITNDGVLRWYKHGTAWQAAKRPGKGQTKLIRAGKIINRFFRAVTALSTPLTQTENCIGIVTSATQRELKPGTGQRKSAAIGRRSSKWLAPGTDCFTPSSPRAN